MSEPIDTLGFIAQLAGKAIEGERKQRREIGVASSSERTEALLLHLTIIKRLARKALPDSERSALPPEKNPALIRQLAQEIREAADELERKRSVH